MKSLHAARNNSLKNLDIFASSKEKVQRLHKFSVNSKIDQPNLPRKIEHNCYDAIMKYRQYIMRSSEQYLLSIQDLTENDGILVEAFDSTDP